jgi:hypothetical protein
MVCGWCEGCDPVLLVRAARAVILAADESSSERNESVLWRGAEYWDAIGRKSCRSCEPELVPGDVVRVRTSGSGSPSGSDSRAGSRARQNVSLSLARSCT